MEIRLIQEAKESAEEKMVENLLLQQHQQQTLMAMASVSGRSMSPSTSRCWSPPPPNATALYLATVGSGRSTPAAPIPTMLDTGNKNMAWNHPNPQAMLRQHSPSSHFVLDSPTQPSTSPYCMTPPMAPLSSHYQSYSTIRHQLPDNSMSIYNTSSVPGVGMNQHPATHYSHSFNSLPSHSHFVTDPRYRANNVVSPNPMFMKAQRTFSGSIYNPNNMDVNVATGEMRKYDVKIVHLHHPGLSFNSDRINLSFITHWHPPKCLIKGHLALAHLPDQRELNLA
jgi:hypothetical protein